MLWGHCLEMLNHFKQEPHKLCSPPCPCYLLPMDPISVSAAGDPPSREYPLRGHLDGAPIAHTQLSVLLSFLNDLLSSLSEQRRP